MTQRSDMNCSTVLCKAEHSSRTFPENERRQPVSKGNLSQYARLSKCGYPNGFIQTGSGQNFFPFRLSERENDGHFLRRKGRWGKMDTRMDTAVGTPKPLLEKIHF